MNTLEIAKDGTKRYHDGDGRLHRDIGPACIHPLGSQEWYHHGLRHREDGPAVVHANGHVDYWVCGFHTYSSWDPLHDDIVPLVKKAWDLNEQRGRVVTFDELPGAIAPMQIWQCTINRAFPFHGAAYGFFMTGRNFGGLGEVEEDENIHWPDLSKRSIEMENAVYIPDISSEAVRHGNAQIEAGDHVTPMVREFNEPFTLVSGDWETDQRIPPPKFYVPYTESSQRLAWEVEPFDDPEGPFTLEEIRQKIGGYQVWKASGETTTGSYDYLVTGPMIAVSEIQPPRVGGESDFFTVEPAAYRISWPDVLPARELKSFLGAASPSYVWRQDEPFYLVSRDWDGEAHNASLRFNARTATTAQIPTFQSTIQAYDYAAAGMTAEQIPMFQAEHARLSQASANTTLSFDQRIQLATQGQFYREAIEEFQRLHPAPVTAARWDVAPQKGDIVKITASPELLRADGWEVYYNKVQGLVGRVTQLHPYAGPPDVLYFDALFSNGTWSFPLKNWQEYVELVRPGKTSALEKESFEDEIFRWFSAVFDIDEAHAILEKSPRQSYAIQVDKWAPILITHANDEAGEPIRGPVPKGAKAIVPLINVSIDWDHTKEADTSKPGVMIPFNGTYLLIDGHHRLAKAWQQHEPDLQVYLLTEPEAHQILRKPLKLKDVPKSEAGTEEKVEN